MPGEFHGQRDLVSYSPWGHKDSDATERFSLSFTTEPLGKHCEPDDFSFLGRERVYKLGDITVENLEWQKIYGVHLF